jgi:uncharacterized protein (TIRG00374 family)
VWCHADRVSDPVAAVPTPRSRAIPDELSPRHLAIRVAELVAVIAVLVIAINALPGLDEVRARLAGVAPAWVVAVVLAEIGSCAGYLLAFRSTFCSGMSWRLSYDIAMSELAANSLLPAGGAGGLALGVWALRLAGMPTAHIARRSVAFFIVTSAANFFALVIVGIGVFAGVIPGRGSALLTLVPAVITAIGVLLVGLSPRLLRRSAKHDTRGTPEHWRGRVSVKLRAWLGATADGVDQAIALLRSGNVGVATGSFAYMAFDIAALGFGFAAVGHVPLFGVLVLGYLIGQLGNLIPIPGGIGGTEGALIGFFVLYGVNVTQATAAVLIYRLFALVVPAALGAPAFVLLRRKLTRADQPGLVCAPLALEVVKLPART